KLSDEFNRVPSHSRSRRTKAEGFWRADSDRNKKLSPRESAPKLRPPRRYSTGLGAAPAFESQPERDIAAIRGRRICRANFARAVLCLARFTATCSRGSSAASSGRGVSDSSRPHKKKKSLQLFARSVTGLLSISADSLAASTRLGC